MPSLKKIALEEHVIFPDFIEYFTANKTTIARDLYDKAIPALSDFGGKRIELMDECGIDFAVLSLCGPGVQSEPFADLAVALARKANDKLAAEVRKRPDRFGGFAHLPMQDPESAAEELERCMREYNFRGALINGHTNGVYLDDRRYDVFWERASALNAPIYIHPISSFDRPAMYDDHPELWGPTWSWAVETCTHALRLVCGGVFDRYPNAKVILGHMGETLPIQLWRLDSRYAESNRKNVIKKKPSDYIKSNIVITTAGVCSDEAVRCSLDAIGRESVMFSVDYPFESMAIATQWITSANVSEEERVLVAHKNAERILSLSA